MCQLAAAMAPKVLTTVGRFETLYSSRTTFGFRYTSSRPESRLVCICRQVAWATPVEKRAAADENMESIISRVVKVRKAS